MPLAFDDDDPPAPKPAAAPKKGPAKPKGTPPSPQEIHKEATSKPAETDANSPLLKFMAEHVQKWPITQRIVVEKGPQAGETGAVKGHQVDSVRISGSDATSYEGVIEVEWDIPRTEPPILPSRVPVSECRYAGINDATKEVSVHRRTMAAVGKAKKEKPVDLKAQAESYAAKWPVGTFVKSMSDPQRHTRGVILSPPRIESWKGAGDHVVVTVLWPDRDLPPAGRLFQLGTEAVGGLNETEVKFDWKSLIVAASKIEPDFNWGVDIRIKKSEIDLAMVDVFLAQSYQLAKDSKDPTFKGVDWKALGVFETLERAEKLLKSNKTEATPPPSKPAVPLTPPDPPKTPEVKAPETKVPVKETSAASATPPNEAAKPKVEKSTALETVKPKETPGLKEAFLGLVDNLGLAELIGLPVNFDLQAALTVLKDLKSIIGLPVGHDPKYQAERIQTDHYHVQTAHAALQYALSEAETSFEAWLASQVHENYRLAREQYEKDLQGYKSKANEKPLAPDRSSIKDQIKANPLWLSYSRAINRLRYWAMMIEKVAVDGHSRKAFLMMNLHKNDPMGNITATTQDELDQLTPGAKDGMEHSYVEGLGEGAKTPPSKPAAAKPPAKVAELPPKAPPKSPPKIVEEPTPMDDELAKKLGYDPETAKLFPWLLNEKPLRGPCPLCKGEAYTLDGKIYEVSRKEHNCKKNDDIEDGFATFDVGDPFEEVKSKTPVDGEPNYEANGADEPTGSTQEASTDSESTTDDFFDGIDPNALG
jgi:hypothetical protein